MAKYEKGQSVSLESIADLSTITGKQIDDRARALARALVRKDRLKTNQIRNIYSSIDRMRSTFQRDRGFSERLADELWLIKPKLAYAAGRQRAVNDNLFPFMEEVINAVDKAEDKEKAMQNFFSLLESVVGYHKYFENVKSAE